MRKGQDLPANLNALSLIQNKPHSRPLWNDGRWQHTLPASIHIHPKLVSNPRTSPSFIPFIPNALT